MERCFWAMNELGVLSARPGSVSTASRPFPFSWATMGPIGKLKLCTGALAGLGVGAFGYLGASTTVISPLPEDDPLWRSKSFAKYNLHRNPSTQDICLKRIPLGKIRPELLENEGDFALEFCRGVWSGLGTQARKQRMRFNESIVGSEVVRLTSPWLTGDE